PPAHVVRGEHLAAAAALAGAVHVAVDRAPAGRIGRRRRRERQRRGGQEHDPEKWVPVFGKDPAPTRSCRRRNRQRRRAHHAASVCMVGTIECGMSTTSVSNSSSVPLITGSPGSSSEGWYQGRRSFTPVSSTRAISAPISSPCSGASFLSWSSL